MPNYLGTSLTKDLADVLLAMRGGMPSIGLHSSTRKALISRGLIKKNLIGGSYILTDFGRKVVVEIASRRKEQPAVEAPPTAFAPQQIHDIIAAQDMTDELRKGQRAAGITDPWYVMIIFGGDGFYAISRGYALRQADQLIDTDHSCHIGRNLEQALTWLRGYNRIVTEA